MNVPPKASGRFHGSSAATRRITRAAATSATAPPAIIAR
jgi:hypothetical protein